MITLVLRFEASGKVAGFDAKTRLAEGDLILQNNLWYGFGAGTPLLYRGEDKHIYLSDAANAVADVVLGQD